MKLAKGHTRNVFLIGKFAVKIARNKKSKLCNIAEFYKSNQLTAFEKNMIAPVLLCLFNGWVIIQSRCKEAHNEVLFATSEGKTLTENNKLNLHAENHYSNVGYLKGRLVYFDYA